MTRGGCCVVIVPSHAQGGGKRSRNDLEGKTASTPVPAEPAAPLPGMLIDENAHCSLPYLPHPFPDHGVCAI